MKPGTMYSSRAIKKWKEAPLEFWIRECGAGGDCMFHCLAAGLGELHDRAFTMEQVREMLAATLTEHNVDRFLEACAEDQDHKRFQGSVTCSDILRLPSLKNRLVATQQLVRTPGWWFLGTDVALRWLLKRSPWFRRTGVVALNAFGPGHSFWQGKPSETDSYLLLFNTGNAHWQLALIESDGKLYSCIPVGSFPLLKRFL